MNKYLDSVLKQFRYYKSLGDKSMTFLNDHDIHWQYNDQSNSMAVMVKHIAGNMLSRWTNFLTEDGEKSWRHRDQEFEDTISSKAEMLEVWEKGWVVLFNAITPLQEDDLNRIVYIRNEGHTVTEAINRQLMHYGYHIGQMVYLARMIAGENWTSLSIPKGQSVEYNERKFSEEKGERHFTEDL